MALKATCGNEPAAELLVVVGVHKLLPLFRVNKMSWVCLEVERKCRLEGVRSLNELKVTRGSRPGIPRNSHPSFCSFYIGGFSNLVTVLSCKHFCFLNHVLS